MIFLVILLGLGGVALANYSQEIYKDVEKSRFDHNAEVLRRAKNALLMYAYNYPSISLIATGTASGPGRLPCPDTDDDDIGETDLNCSNGGPLVGRFPTLENGMNGEDFKDSSGNRLWYAVSHTFSRFKSAPNVINSDSLGSITVRDTSGNILYDGSADSGGIAAVIIAPGPPIERTDGFVQTRIQRGQLDPLNDRINPNNYLDVVFGEDNASFTFGDRNSGNGVADGDGFVLGPVYDGVTKSYITNDQMIIITPDEVATMAEKSVLETYRDAVNDYLANTGDVYPWLFNYDVDTINDIYDYPTRGAFTSNLTNIGRVPSMFTEYFKADVVASDPLDSELWIQIRYMGITDWLISPGENFTGTARVSITTDGDISYTGLPMYSPADKTFYFWDDEASPDGFELCPAGGDELDDCNRDASGNPTPGSANNHKAAIIRKITMEFKSIDGSDTLDLNDMLPDTTDCTQPDNCLPADGGRHAFISASYGADVFNNVVDKVSYEEDNFYMNSFDVTDDGEMSFADGAGSIRMGVRYYPVLPAWAKTNNWHQSVLMSYAQPYRPDVVGTCVAGVDCLQILNSATPINNKISLITIAGSTNIDDDDGNFTNDLSEIFDPGNDDLDDTFDVRVPGGDDKILVVNTL